VSARDSKRRLIVGIGNEFRRDDGIGFIVAGLADLRGFEVMAVAGINPELAETLKDYDVVVFVDASVEGPPVEVKRIGPEDTTLPLYHHITCGGILSLTQALYHKVPEAYLLSVRGYDFDHGEGLSDRARENVGLALERLKGLGLELNPDRRS
jgi:hydrogenase maturation protease